MSRGIVRSSASNICCTRRGFGMYSPFARPAIAMPIWFTPAERIGPRPNSLMNVTPEVAKAIKTMVIRGAPAIGVAAAITAVTVSSLRPMSMPPRTLLKMRLRSKRAWSWGRPG